MNMTRQQKEQRNLKIWEQILNGQENSSLFFLCYSVPITPEKPSFHAPLDKIDKKKQF